MTSQQVEARNLHAAAADDDDDCDDDDFFGNW